MNRDRTYIIISKKLAGELTEAENAEFEKWLENPQNLAHYNLMKKVWEVDYVSKKKQKEDELFAKILSGIDKSPENETDGKEIKLPRSSGFKYILRYAAIITMVVIGGWLINRFVSRAPADMANQHVSLIEKRNPVGIQKSKLTLPDGSTVLINGNSSIKYAEGLKGSTREIELIGEAYFKVAKDKSRPFIIRSENLVTTAVGTAFNVRAYPDDNIMQVAVTEGEVKINSTEDPEKLYFIKPGTELTYEKKTEKISTKEYSEEEVLAWIDGVIYFRNASMFEVVRKLERWYNIDIEIVGTSDYTWQFSGEFKNEVLENIIMGLSYAQGFEYEMKEDKVIIILNK